MSGSFGTLVTCSKTTHSRRGNCLRRRRSARIRRAQGATNKIGDASARCSTCRRRRRRRSEGNTRICDNRQDSGRTGGCCHQVSGFRSVLLCSLLSPDRISTYETPLAKRNHARPDTKACHCVDGLVTAAVRNIRRCVLYGSVIATYRFEDCSFQLCRQTLESRHGLRVRREVPVGRDEYMMFLSHDASLRIAFIIRCCHGQSQVCPKKLGVMASYDKRTSVRCVRKFSEDEQSRDITRWLSLERRWRTTPNPRQGCIT
jgi:hypothetical protein